MSGSETSNIDPLPCSVVSSIVPLDARTIRSRKGLERGALAFLEKPIDAVSLGQNLERAASDEA